ncbi:hypothetical protein ASPFODRAFT_40908 [Aspergillus luchuensis CBS 106.47]|uniref:Uncharacterized protein n=1 Tax=Aspergillus luchuensis (strain CBS 106.47) TaxID=1137211 RepID=A0A1M3TV21_ASPLC|nr:hypothetical protein ASPFODRAFT_40908 [Aspergillus luchuensis CBS 106.47]
MSDIRPWTYIRCYVASAGFYTELYICMYCIVINFPVSGEDTSAGALYLICFNYHHFVQSK